MASSISFKAYNLVYMFFRAKISTADLSIQPPIQSASLQETKNLSQVPRNKDHHSPGNLCKNRAKTCFSLPFKLVASGHYLSGETEGAGFHSCCLVFFFYFFLHPQAKQHGLKHFVLCSWQLSQVRLAGSLLCSPPKRSLVAFSRISKAVLGARAQVSGEVVSPIGSSRHHSAGL